MKQNLLFLISFILTTMACSPVKKTQLPVIEEGITGVVYKVSGNQMPMVGAAPGQPKGFATTIYVYELTNIKDVVRADNTSPFYTAIHTKEVATVTSDSTGAFTVRLAPGSYSLFTKQGNRFYANLFDNNNNIAVTTVEKRKLTKIKIMMDAGAVY